MFKSESDEGKKLAIFSTVSLTRLSILQILSPVTHFGFYFAKNELVHGSFFLDPFAIGYLIYIFVIFYQLIKYRKYI